MAFADLLRSSTATMSDIAALIEGIWSSSYGLAWTSWEATPTGSGSMSFSGVSTTAKYVQCGKLIIATVRLTATIANVSTDIKLGLPVNPTGIDLMPGWGWASNPTGIMRVFTNTSDNKLYFNRYDGGNWTAGATQMCGTVIYQSV